MNPDETQLVAKTVDPNGDIIEQVLRIACYDEYRANAYYQKVIDTFGAVTPFSNIVQAEVRHYSMLESLCAKYGVQPPINDWYDKIVIGSSILECCQDGINAEIANIEMYDHLLPYIDAADIRDVFYREQAASYNNHLPAFEQCAAMQNAQSNGFNSQQLNDMIQEMATGRFDASKLPEMFGSLFSRDLLIGAALGALAVGAFQSNLFKTDDKE